MLEAREYKYPPHVWEIKEIQAVNKAVDYVIDQVEADVESLEKMLLISTSDENGISRYERILGLSPQDTETLDERRYNAATKYYDSYPYTEKDVRGRLDRLIPNRDYEMTVTNGSVKVYVGLASASMLEATRKLLEDIVPLHTLLEVDIRYNRHSAIATALSTYGALETYTHTQLREDDLSEE